MCVRKKALVFTVAAALLSTACGTASSREFVRLPGNPIITADMLPGADGDNINGPSLIRAPSWVEEPLGRYYLYFAHHGGEYIRLAYADDVAGPWAIHEPGTLHIDGARTAGCAGHIASPDVHVVEESRQVRMYFHCPVEWERTQLTFLATSSDGLSFEVGDEPLGDSYFRVFEWGGSFYALARQGVLYRSASGTGDFETGPQIFQDGLRHSAVSVDGDTALVYYSRIGDRPERILVSEVDLSGDWSGWKPAPPRLVLEPEEPYEGVALPLATSNSGGALVPLRQLRDPAVFHDGGATYLLYSVAGESGIAIAEVAGDR